MPKKIIFGCFVIVIAYSSLLLYRWSSVADTIPIHYNLSGNVDGWGNKMAVILLPIVNLLLLSILLFLVGRPHLLNYPINMKEENRETVYRIGKNLLASLSLIITLLFGVLTLQSIGVIDLFFSVFVLMGALIISVIVFLVRLYDVR